MAEGAGGTAAGAGGGVGARGPAGPGAGPAGRFGDFGADGCSAGDRLERKVDGGAIWVSSGASARGSRVAPGSPPRAADATPERAPDQVHTAAGDGLDGIAYLPKEQDAEARQLKSAKGYL